MIIRRIGNAATPPISLLQAKDHLRVTADDEDVLISALIAAACDAISAESGRTFAAETWEIADTGFSGEITLPRSPVVSLTSVKYYVDGVLTTADVADFRLYETEDRTMVGPIEGASWPMGQTRPDGTVIRFVAGYTTLPAALHQAALLMIGHMFSNREAVGEAMTELPLAVHHLVGLHRIGWVAA